MSAIFCGLCLSLAALPARADGVNAVASIAPVHSLLAGVMEGVGEPGLLVRGGRSPHDYVMKPSDAKMLHAAQAVFWIGPDMEGFLAKPIHALAAKVRVVRLGGNSDGAEGEEPHIWLDPRIAARMVGDMVRVLAEIDGANAARYRGNGKKIRAGLIALERDLHAFLKPIAVVPYLVYHDAYRHFEKRFDLASQGAVAVHAERPPGAKRVSALRRLIVAKKIVCVFTEPQFTPALAKMLTQGTGARLGVLDPLGAALPEGPGLYAGMMRGMARSMLACLGANG
ncbi:MAG: zinc ABC transporter substrate-binding protein [Proteobacteria bacterium]|nr:zinc ABC transporter substrate-binding protein [Pseudomonadota bacterium]